MSVWNFCPRGRKTDNKKKNSFYHISAMEKMKEEI